MEERLDEDLDQMEVMMTLRELKKLLNDDGKKRKSLHADVSLGFKNLYGSMLAEKKTEPMKAVAPLPIPVYIVDKPKGIDFLNAASLE